jgi:hypothetical protein
VVLYRSFCSLIFVCSAFLPSSVRCDFALAKRRVERVIRERCTGKARYNMVLWESQAKGKDGGQGLERWVELVRGERWEGD